MFSLFKEFGKLDFEILWGFRSSLIAFGNFFFNFLNYITYTINILAPKLIN